MPRNLLLILGLLVGCSNPDENPERPENSSVAGPDEGDPAQQPRPALDCGLSPESWRADYDRFMRQQGIDRTSAGMAIGKKQAVTVAYNGLAARAGLEAMRQGGNALDAALTGAIAQVALTMGAPISYFGILSLVYYDAKSDTVHTMNAEWNTVLAETDGMTIPGGIDMSSPEGLTGTAASGRTAMVGGFMKGVGAAHERFGAIPFDQLFAPAIHIAEEGMPISEKLAACWTMRVDDLARLAETKQTFLKEDGSGFVAGDVFRQPALARTLRAVARDGTDHMYKGPWAQRLVAAVQADGGRMTLEDLARYEVIWDEPMIGDLGGGYQVFTNPPPNNGGAALIQAQQLARAARLTDDGHWTESSEALRKALDITQLFVLDFLPPATLESVYPGVDFSPEGRIRIEHATELWKRVEAGARVTAWKPQPPRHSDDIVAIDEAGNIAAITHSINCVIWGKTAMVVDGITIGDPASFQQAAIAAVEPGSRLPAPTETGILFKDGEAILGFASMGSGLHQRTFQGLASVIHYDMTVDEAIDSPDFFMPRADQTGGAFSFVVPEDRYLKEVLDGTGYDYVEVPSKDARFNGEGLWVAIQRDPKTGALRAASHNRNNSAAAAD